MDIKCSCGQWPRDFNLTLAQRSGWKKKEGADAPTSALPHPPFLQCYWSTSLQKIRCSFSQATNKKNIPSAKSELWWVFSRLTAAAENAGFCWKSGARRIPLCYIAFPAPQSITSSQGFLPISPAERSNLQAASRDWDFQQSLARSDCTFHLITIFHSFSNVVKANVYRLLNITILTLCCSQHRQNHTQQYERQNLLQFGALTEHILVSSVNKNAFVLPLLPLVLVNIAIELYSLGI